MSEDFTLYVHRDVNMPFDAIMRCAESLARTAWRCVGAPPNRHIEDIVGGIPLADRFFTLKLHRDLDDSEGPIFGDLLRALQAIADDRGFIVVDGLLADGHYAYIPTHTGLTADDGVSLIECLVRPSRLS